MVELQETDLLVQVMEILMNRLRMMMLQMEIEKEYSYIYSLDSRDIIQGTLQLELLYPLVYVSILQ